MLSPWEIARRQLLTAYGPPDAYNGIPPSLDLDLATNLMTRTCAQLIEKDVALDGHTYKAM